MTLAVVSFVVLSTLALANLGRQLTSADQLEPDQCRPEEDPTCSGKLWAVVGVESARQQKQLTSNFLTPNPTS